MADIVLNMIGICSIRVVFKAKWLLFIYFWMIFIFRLLDLRLKWNSVLTAFSKHFFFLFFLFFFTDISIVFGEIFLDEFCKLLS